MWMKTLSFLNNLHITELMNLLLWINIFLASMQISCLPTKPFSNLYMFNWGKHFSSMALLGQERHLYTRLCAIASMQMDTLYFVWHHLAFLPSSFQVVEQHTPHFPFQLIAFVKTHYATLTKTQSKLSCCDVLC